MNIADDNRPDPLAELKRSVLDQIREAENTLTWQWVSAHVGHNVVHVVDRGAFACIDCMAMFRAEVVWPSIEWPRLNDNDVRYDVVPRILGLTMREMERLRSVASLTPPVA